ncbi:MAG: 2-amino-4-hydroxy-6-hydroxymethyldihydropteridine diphosphokinase [Chloroflexi bacterium]|nr:2-amino-4-hydroxy-6-hydroxymethyldihydropteridine diphosphokinase [Chloroflexota bacterium]
MKDVEIYLGLGSNLGDRMGNLESAVERLSEKVTINKISSVYETDPLYNTEQPMFLNAVLRGVTRLAPLELLNFVKGIESALGRQPSFRNAPRLIDIDILFYGKRVIQTGELTVPHPHIAERAFVLVPLAEIAPELVHPQLKKKVSDLLADVEGKNGVRKTRMLGQKVKLIAEN